MGEKIKLGISSRRIWYKDTHLRFKHKPGYSIETEMRLMITGQGPYSPDSGSQSLFWESKYVLGVLCGNKGSRSLLELRFVIASQGKNLSDASNSSTSDSRIPSARLLEFLLLTMPAFIGRHH